MQVAYTKWATEIIPEDRPWKPLSMATCEQVLGTVRRHLKECVPDNIDAHLHLEQAMQKQAVKNFASSLINKGRTHKYASDQVCLKGKWESIHDLSGIELTNIRQMVFHKDLKEKNGFQASFLLLTCLQLLPYNFGDNN